MYLLPKISLTETTTIVALNFVSHSLLNIKILSIKINCAKGQLISKLFFVSSFGPKTNKSFKGSEIALHKKK